MRFCTSGDLSAAMISMYNLATTSFGVPAGAKTPYHVDISNPGKPASASVGTSGNSGERLSAALVWDMRHLHARELLERLAGEMLRAAGARRRIVETVRLRLHLRD